MKYKCVCGSVTFTTSYRVTGRWETYITFKENGVHTEGLGDSVRAVKSPRFMRCSECNKRQPIPLEIQI